MLFIIDIQNKYLDPGGEKDYIEGSEKLVPGIIEKIEEVEKRGEKIFYTLDIYTDKTNTKVHDLENIEKKEEIADSKEKWKSRLFPALKPYLQHHEALKKSYYAFSPDRLLSIQEKFKGREDEIKNIEFLGVETHICVLANAIAIQSAFPEAQIIIDSKLSMSRDRKDHEMALEIMEKLE